ELGHLPIPMEGLLDPGQPVPVCGCGQAGDVESIASLTAIRNHLLPYELSRNPDHELAEIESPGQAARLGRSYGAKGEPLGLRILGKQAKALGRRFHTAADFTDPDAYFVGGGVAQPGPHFREWFLAKVIESTRLREEQAKVATVALVPVLDM